MNAIRYSFAGTHTRIVSLIGCSRWSYRNVNTLPASTTALNLPNILTFSRIASTPILSYAIYTQRPLLAASLLAYAGLSDGLDGWLARRYDMKSALGSILDPAADKILIGTLVGTLWYTSQLPNWLVALIVGRDIALTLGVLFLRARLLPNPSFRSFFDFKKYAMTAEPTRISKWNTFLQLLLVGATTVSPLLPILDPALTSMQILVGATTVLSTLSYVRGRSVKLNVNS